MVNNGIDFLRQEALGLSVPDSVAVVGCGGVGSWAAYFLALAGVKKLWLFDKDVISGHNLNRMPLPTSSIGALKSNAVKSAILALRPDCQIYALGAFSKETAQALKLSQEISWLIATTDTVLSRQMASQWANTNSVYYIEAAAEGEQGSATGEPADWSTPAEINPGYASPPAWVGPCVSSAMIAVAHILHGTPMGDRTIRMGWEGDRFNMFDSEEKK